MQVNGKCRAINWPLPWQMWLVLIRQQDRGDRPVSGSHIDDEFQMNLGGRCCTGVVRIEARTEKDCPVFVPMHDFGGSRPQH